MDRHPHAHEAIAKHFHISNRQRRRGLPWTASQRYTRNNLAQVYVDLGWTVGAEVGVRRGQYSEVLCRDNPGVHLYCIDPWMADYKYTAGRQEEYYQRAIERLAPYNVTILRKTSMEALADIPDDTLDFIFIDGNHHFEYIMMDIICWSKKVKSGGIVSCHDYACGETGVTCAIEAYVRAYHIDPWYATKEIEKTVWWVKP
jgi:hypothetical protein